MLKSHTAIGTLVALVLTTSSAGAVPFGNEPMTVDLGGGLRASRVPQTCRLTQNYPAQGCFAWQLTGFRAPLPIRLLGAWAFAGVAGGRVLASSGEGVFYTDDRGATWLPTRFDHGAGPLAIAMEPRGEFGVAVGAGGRVWSTEDRGLSWRERREENGHVLVDVALIGHTAVYRDDRGGAWAWNADSSRLDTLQEARIGIPVAEIEVHAGFLIVHTDANHGVRVGRDGDVERIEIDANE